MERLRKYLGGLIERHMLIRRFALLVSVIAFAAFAWQAFFILRSRPDGAVTAEEVALIGLFCGTGGLASYLYQRGRE